MEDRPRVREALHDAVGDIEPAPFRDVIDDVLADARLTPAVLTVRTARAISTTADVEAAHRRGAAVQLSYEGLKLTRELADADPWASAAADTTADADIELIAAGTLVARGFSMLAFSGVAREGIEVVRRFGRNRTNELQGSPPDHPSLEYEVIKLAVETGADLVLSTVSTDLSEYAAALATDLEALPLPEPEAIAVDLETEIQRLLVSQPPISAQEVYHSSTET